MKCSIGKWLVTDWQSIGIDGQEVDHRTDRMGSNQWLNGIDNQRSGWSASVSSIDTCVGLAVGLGLDLGGHSRSIAWDVNITFNISHLYITADIENHNRDTASETTLDSSRDWRSLFGKCFQCLQCFHCFTAFASIDRTIVRIVSAVIGVIAESWPQFDCLTLQSIQGIQVTEDWRLKTQGLSHSDSQALSLVLDAFFGQHFLVHCIPVYT